VRRQYASSTWPGIRPRPSNLSRMIAERAMRATPEASVTRNNRLRKLRFLQTVLDASPKTTADRKRLLRAYDKAHAAVATAERDYQYPPPVFPPFPEECRGLACDAKTRKGTPCKRTDLYENGRCPLHGGLSTGPRTAEGRQRSAANLPKPHEGMTKANISAIDAAEDRHRKAGNARPC
jgi:hypothetical protein